MKRIFLFIVTNLAVMLVLGIPGWWAANEDPAFYADAKVFRPPRLKAGAPP